MWIIGCGHVLYAPWPWPCHLSSYVIFNCSLLQCINMNSLSFAFHYFLGSSIHKTPHTTQPRLLLVKQPFLGASVGWRLENGVIIVAFELLVVLVLSLVYKILWNGITDRWVFVCAMLTHFFLIVKEWGHKQEANFFFLIKLS